MDNICRVNDNHVENKRHGNVLPKAKVKPYPNNSNSHGIATAILRHSIRRACLAYTAAHSLYSHFPNSHLH